MTDGQHPKTGDAYAEALLAETPEGAVLWDLAVRRDGMWLMIVQEGQVLQALQFDEDQSRYLHECIGRAIDHRWGPPRC